jgi:hypothetical protein
MLACLLFAALSLGAMVGLSECASGFPEGQRARGITTYSLVETVTSGTLSHTFDLTLIVQK